MHRFILRNTANDPRTLALRSQHPGKVLLRPVVAGSRLAPNGSMILHLHEFTQPMLSDIERLSAVGNVQLLAVGNTGGIADINAIRSKRGWMVQETPVLVEAPPAVQAVEVPAAAPVLEVPVPSAPEVPAAVPEVGAPDAGEAPQEDAPAAPPADEGTPATADAPTKYTEAALEDLKLGELRNLVTQHGGKTAGKNKADLRDWLLAL